jgi:small subunit ribosomal protein S7
MSGKEQVNIQLFHKWDMSNIEIIDPGLKSVINLKPAVIPVTFGRHEHQRLKTIEEALAKEIILAANNDMASHAIKKKNEQERIAMASR